MEKTIKAILLTTNQILISEISEIGADIGQPDCKLSNPFVLQNDGKSTGDDNHCEDSFRYPSHVLEKKLFDQNLAACSHHKRYGS